jgi:NADH-quinone oxidoreductase E subunit
MGQAGTTSTNGKHLAPGQRLAVGGKGSLSDGALASIRSLASRYPDKLAATLPALYEAQRDMGFVSLAAMQEVAKALDIPNSHVYGVATFYTMFRKSPTGRFHIEVCTNLCCALRGGAGILDRLRERLGVKEDEASADGMWSLEEVECLGSCGTGPCVQINHSLYDEMLDEASLDALIEACRNGQVTEWGTK